MLLQSAARPLMVWRSHGLEAKVDAAIAKHVKRRVGGARAVLQWAAGNRLRWAQQQAVRWSDGAIVPCADDRTFLIEHFDAEPERVRVVWHGVPDEYIDAPQAPAPGRWKRILHVSQLSANKGGLVMKDVAAQVLAARPEASMTWVCPASSHDGILSDLPDELRTRVTLRDWTSRESLMTLFDAHGIFLFPTLAEGAAKVVMEAMSRGLCVVSSDTSGPSDYIRPRENGLLVPVGDAAAMTAATLELLEDEDACRGMSEGALRTALEFRWSRCAKQITDFYETLDAMRSTEKKS
jgi:glycosyltransferase involved in cell wall biosynthesis